MPKPPGTMPCVHQSPGTGAKMKLPNEFHIRSSSFPIEIAPLLLWRAKAQAKTKLPEEFHIRLFFHLLQTPCFRKTCKRDTSLGSCPPCPSAPQNALHAPEPKAETKMKPLQAFHIRPRFHLQTPGLSQSSLKHLLWGNAPIVKHP